MGSILYDFLCDSLLFEEKRIEDAFAGISDSELSKELSRYREFCLRNLNLLAEDVGKTHSELKVFTATESPPVNLLKQSAFYVEQFIICDPLFAESVPIDLITQMMGKNLGLDDVGLDRKRLVTVIRKMKMLGPMVAADYVKILPTSYFFEPPNELPFYYSENDYSEGIPDPLLDFFHRNARVQSLERVKPGYATTGKLFPCRTIAVDFDDESPEIGMCFQLFETEVLSTDDQERTAEFSMNLPHYAPGKVLFDVWVKQSINRTAHNILRSTKRQIHMASKLNSSLMTNSRFISDLLHQSVAIKPKISTDTANQLLKLDLPFVDKVDTAALMEVRQNDGESFHNFRRELERQFRELRSIKDISELQTKTENVLHELSEVQVRQVQQKVAFLKKKLFIDSVVLIGGLAGTIQTGGWSLLASAIAAAKGYQSVQDYFQNTRQNPAFFLWKVLDQSK